MKAKVNDIFITPVKKYAPPKYPTRTDATHTPELLRKLPSRWQKNAAVVAAVGMLGAMTLTSCGVPNSDPALQEQKVTDNINETGYLDGDVIMEIPTEQEFMLEGEPALPVFTTEQEVTDELCTTDNTEEEMFPLAGAPPIHDFSSEQDYIEPEETTIERNFLDTSYIGPVAGGMGPLQYLSETDALTIIQVMAQQNGLKFEELPPNLEDAPPYYSDVTTKLYDVEKQVGVEYSRRNSTWETYISSEGIAVGSFRIYGYWDEANVENETDMHAFLEQDLREQVRDFIEWLQGQGII
ncbi:MAG: hypothetical protein FWF92_09260 [Oscillospiraceae bacterium]|nr:hypothetical protein [Oscillospiraceae bacterium]